MFKDTIKYTKFNGETVEKPFYFNINETEFQKWQLGRNEAPEYMKHQAESLEEKGLFDIYYSLIDVAYGEPTEDFEGFMKTPEILAKFKSTDAYNQLCIKMISDPEYAEKFMKGCLPKRYANLFDESMNEAKKSLPAISSSNTTE